MKLKHIIIIAAAFALAGCGGVMQAANSGWEKHIGDSKAAYDRLPKWNITLERCGLKILAYNAPAYADNAQDAADRFAEKWDILFEQEWGAPPDKYSRVCRAYRKEYSAAVKYEPTPPCKQKRDHAAIATRTPDALIVEFYHQCGEAE